MAARAPHTIALALWIASVRSTLLAQEDAQPSLDDEPSQVQTEDRGEAQASSSPTAADEPTSAEADREATVFVQPFAGMGVSTRSFTRPTNPGVQRLSASVVPAAEVGLEVTAWPKGDFTLAFRLHYQSAIALTLTERPPFALSNEVEARSERVELRVAPGLRFGTARLSVPIGAIVRTFWPSVHTQLTPGYSLIGPYAGIELTTALAGPLSIVISPEVQWIVLIDDALLATGLNRQGIALGGNAALVLGLSTVWSLSVAFRESHALVSTWRGMTFEDVERYITLRVIGSP